MSDQLQIEKLEKRIKEQEQHIKNLQKMVGSWKRLSQEKGPRRETLKEGYVNDYPDHYHYVVHVIQDVPADLNYAVVLKELEENFLPGVQPYTFKRMDYSKKYAGWLVEVRYYLPRKVAYRG